jgi:hypothetical protein
MVFGRQRGDRQHRARDSHTLTVRQASTQFDPGHSTLWPRLFDPQAQAAVVDQQLTVRLENRERFTIGQTQVPGVAWHLLEVDPHHGTRYEFDPTLRHRTNAELGSLQIDEDPNGPSDLALDTADRPHIACQCGVIGMTHVDAEDVCTRFEQTADCVRLPRCRAQSGDDFHTAAAVHAIPILFLTSLHLPCSVARSCICPHEMEPPAVAWSAPGHRV